MRTKTASKLSDTQTIWMGPRVPERVQKTGSALVSSMSGIEIQRMNRCDWVFAHSLHPVLTRDSAVELNLWLKRTYGRIGCILRLLERANWSFGGGVSLTDLQTFT